MMRTARPAADKTRRQRKEQPAARLDALIEEATVDAHDESEQTTGFYTMLEDHLAMPFSTEVLGMDFNVNSKNFTEQSRGTTGWIAECRRLLDRCVEQAKTADPAEVCQAFGIIFGLLDRIDDGRENIIFFPDEAGAWQVGVHWEKVLPPWFTVLSATAEPEEYWPRIVILLKHHYAYESAGMLAVARKIATPAQRQALPKPQAGAGPPRPARS